MCCLIFCRYFRHKAFAINHRLSSKNTQLDNVRYLIKRIEEPFKRMKSKHIMMCSSIIVAAFVSVLIYSSDGLGMITVAAAETATVAEGGKEEGETNGTMMTVLDGVPATSTAPRKLTKKSKASNDDVSLSQEVRGLLGRLVFEKAMELYRFVQPSSDDAARADNDGRALWDGGPMFRRPGVSRGKWSVSGRGTTFRPGDRTKGRV